MKVSMEWLKEYVAIENVQAVDLAEKITRAGIEIDEVENRNKGINKIVVGYVVSKEKHPDADKLNVCIVDAGQDEQLQIVCGAKNVDAGQKVPVALIGAKMPDGMEIKKAKLRGVPSQGMICSAKELGLNDKLLPKSQQEGIMVLPQDVEIGTPISDILGLNDYVLEFDLTPNRSDCLSMHGAAFEVGAILGSAVHIADPLDNISENGDAASTHISVSISSLEYCSHYAARYITGVTLTASPQWMQNRLMAAGIRPINNIVDITNYVMLEYGQPLHAFDADKLNNGAIDVRLAQAGETLITLDGQERKLEPHMLLVTDGVKPVALAGVMGGANTEVTEQTVNILLESAHFDGGVVRKTSRQLGLRSEASLRFEKEVDRNSVIPALNRAAALIAELAGGTIHLGVVESLSSSVERLTIALSLDKLNRVLGTDLSMIQVKEIFDRLNFGYTEKSSDVLEVKVPSRRGDITRDVDLMEEVARLYGYDNIPTTAIEGPITPGAYTKPQTLRRDLRRLLTHGGWQELISYSFTHPAQTTVFPTLSSGTKAVKLAMPMSEERSVLRTSIIPQMLDAASYNVNRKISDLAFFEMGHIFLSNEEQLTKQPQEVPVLSLLLSGNIGQKQWNVNPVQVDFFDLKGALETVFTHLALQNAITYVANQPQGYHPGRSASIYLDQGGRGQLLLGTLGQVHPEIQLECDLEDVYVAEILLQPLFDHTDYDVKYRDLPRYPAVERDIAIVVDQSTEAGSLLSTIRKVAGELLQSVQVFDVYTGSKLGDNKKSVAISLVYRHQERTMTDEEITTLHGTVVTALEQTFNAELRK
ncbi:phenylalanine--tRNA ligase subunit beta [Paenibacillus sp. CMAA1364]